VFSYSRAAARFVALVAAVCVTQLFAEGTKKMDRTEAIARQSYSVQLFANGQDVTAGFPIASVKYNADGTGSRKLKNGQVVNGSWKFMNPQQTQVEVNGPDGTSRWVIVEFNERIYRKVNMDTGVEFIHRPISE
jgi:hypothetical protein